MPTPHETLTRLVWPSPVLNENAERKRRWIAHLFDAALADVLASPGTHPDPESEARFLAGLRATGPTMRGEEPPTETSSREAA